MNKTEYQEYLASREWALKREAIRERSNGTCERCWDGKMDAVHHLTYIRVGNEVLEDLMAICDPCHEFISAKSDIDPRTRWKKTPVNLEDGAALACPHCNELYLHQTRVEIFARVGGEDADSEVVAINNSTASIDRYSVNRNPSLRRDGLLIYFWCELCMVGTPPRNELSTEEKDDIGTLCYEIPLALAVYQHKGTTYVEWVPVIALNKHNAAAAV